jgi:MraZ protein
MSTELPTFDYFGEYEHRLDARNRVTVPSSWRVPGDEGNFYFAWPHPEGCLAVFPPEELAELKRRARGMKVSDARANRLLRLVFGKGSKFGCDGQGRILLPKHLLEHAKVTKEVVMVGLGRYFQVWSADSYESVGDENFDMLSAMEELGI